MKTKFKFQIIVILLILGFNIAKVEDLPFTKQSDIFVQKGPKVEIDITNLFDLNDLKYPITLKSTPDAPYYTVDRPISTTKYQDNKELDISFTQKLDSSRVLLFQKNSRTVCLQSFSDVELIQEGSKCFSLGEVASTKLVNQEPKPSDMVWQCEDSQYELSAEAYFILCRGKGTMINELKQEPISVEKFAVYGIDNSGEAKSEIKLNMIDFKIKNRAKILVFKNNQSSQDEAQYFNIISDSFIENGKDEPIELKIRVFTSFSFLTADNGEYQIKDTNNVIREPRGFYNFKNKLLLVSKRNGSDTGEKLCFTEIIYNFNAERHKSTFEIGNKFHCTDQTAGYVGMSYGAHITTFDPKDNSINIKPVKLDFNVEKNWILRDNYKKYDLSMANPAPKGGVREVDFSPNGVSIKFSTEKGVFDADEHTFALSDINYSEERYIFKPKTGESGVIINSFFVTFGKSESKVYTLDEPYILYDTNTLSEGVNEITVTAFDASQTEVDKKTSTFKIKVVNNPLAEIEIKSDYKEQVPIQVSAGTTVEHLFPLNYIKKGNSLIYDVKYPEEEAKQHLQSDVKEYINYEIEYDKFSGSKGPEILRSDSAAILFFPSTGSGKGDESSYIQVYRCQNLSFTEEECFLVSQMDLSENDYDLLRIQPRTMLNTTVFFLYNTRVKKTYLFYIDNDEKELNYELFEAKLIDAKFMHLPNGQIIGEYLAEGKGLYVEVFYEDWSFGGKKRILIDESVVGEVGFCGKQIVGSTSWQQTFSVMSNCGNVVEIVKFGFEYDSTIPENTLSVDDVVVKERRDIARNLQNGSICRLRDEWIFYDKDNAKLYSIDLDNWSKEEIDLKILKINIVDFWCKDFNRQAYILHQDKSGETVTNTEIIVIRSGKQYDIYNRIRTRIKNLANETIRFQGYKVGLDVIFVLTQNDKSIFYLRYLNEQASLRTKISHSSEVGKTYEYRLTVDNSVSSQFISNTIQIVSSPPIADFTLKGEKKKIDGEEWITYLSYSVSFTGSSEGLKLVNMNNEEVKPTLEAELKSIVENENYRIDVGDNNTGKFFSLGEDHYLIASYSPEKKSAYGILRLIQNDGKASQYYTRDSFYFSYPFNKVTYLQLDSDTTLMMIGYNGVVGPTYQAIILFKNEFSKPQRSKDIFDNRRLTLIKGLGEKNILAFYQKGDTLFIQSGQYKVNSGGLNDWTLDFDDQTEEETKIVDDIGSFYFVDSEKFITFYYNKKSDQNKFLFIKKYDKSTNKVEEAELAINLPESYPKFLIREVQCVSTEKSNNCVFLTGGSYVVYTEFKKDHDQETPINTLILQLTSEYPAEIPYITSKQVIIQHYPSSTNKPEFTFFDIPSTKELNQDPQMTKIYPAYRWTGEKSTKVLQIIENSEAHPILFIESKNEDKNTRIIRYMEAGPYRLEGKGDPTLDELQNNGFKLGSKKLALREFFNPAIQSSKQDDEKLTIGL